MKICFAVQDMCLGGSSTVVHDIIVNWPVKTDELVLVSFFNLFDERYKDLEKIGNLSIIVLDKTKTIDFKFLKRLKKTIQDIKPDVISSHLTCVFYLKIIGAVKKIPIFHTIHSEPSKDLPFLYRLFIKGDIKKKRIKLIGCCDYISEKAFLLYKTNCKTIRNGIDMSYNVKTNLDFSITRFLYVGRFDKVKNIPLLIKAFDDAKTGDSELIICGFGSQETEIVNSISNCSKKDRIQLIGKSNNVQDLYLKSNVLCLISSREGMPMTVLEGIKNGLAFLATNVGGIGEFVKNDYNGLLLNDCDLKNISLCFEILSSQKKLLLKYQNNSANFKEMIDAKNTAVEYRKAFYE